MFEIYFTSAVIILMTAALVKEVYKASFIMFCALLLLYVGKINSLNDTLAGFSNEGMLTVAALYIVSGVLQSRTSFASAIEKILGNKFDGTIYFRFMFPVTFISSFLDNTPVVASLIPVIKRWAKKNNFPASKFLIPLSYAAMLGGNCTLIGTSTNLVVHGMLLNHGLEGFSFFELTKIALPVAFICTTYFALIGYRLLPDRKDIIEQFAESVREFVVEVKVGEDYPFIDKTIENANLRHLKGLFLFQIMRDGNETANVSPDEIILLNDRLFFTGMPETIYDLLKTPGLHLIKDLEFDLKNIDSDKLNTFEAVVSNSSSLIGSTVRDSSFRTKYDAVILGIYRNGHRINKKVGDIRFQANDTLFILSKKEFDKKWHNSTNFSLVSSGINEYSKSRRKGNLALILMAAMILAVTAGFVQSMLIAACITAGIMIIANIISFKDATNFVDFDVILVIVSALGIGKAIENSGIADLLSHFITNSLGGYGVIGVVAGLYFLTTFFTEIVTNNVAAAFIFPIALSAATGMNLDPKPFIIIITIAASASFATPIGSQTNQMVYNPGGYKFTDFLKTGIIINVLVGIVVITLVNFIFY